MKKLLTVVLISILSASFGASAFAAEHATPKDKLVAEGNAAQHKDTHKSHKSHKSANTEKSEKSASAHENSK
jgi:Ni/Co efflux regulator RcnB